jgi:hypothetical protein
MNTIYIIIIGKDKIDKSKVFFTVITLKLLRKIKDISKSNLSFLHILCELFIFNQFL